MNEIEQGTILELDYSKLEKISEILEKPDVIPVAVQDIDTMEVLIIAYVNKKALEYSLKHRITAFWSTSRNEMWIKGKQSGNILELMEVRINCEQNSLLYLVKSRGGACHTRDKNGEFRRTCFYRKINIPEMNLKFIE